MQVSCNDIQISAYSERLFLLHAAAELGRHFVKTFYKTGKLKLLPDHEQIKYSN